ncbi:hypothetical protein N0V88_002860 [Collariella sp. IMI 366227]|nr:hypothetical protein N0V88_002860 [Collariella sp. IMI 366227]
MSGPLKAAILVVSTTAANDPSTDAAEATLRDVFEQDGGGRWEVTETKIVSDVTTQIQRQIMLWTDAADPVNLVITTGGTGFAVADHTPEAVSVLLHKQAPGLIHAMLASSLAVTPFAMMSRPAAGVRNKTVIITLPGSPKGARENLQAVIKTLPHACLQAAGANSRALHSGGVKKLEQEAHISTKPPHSHHSDAHTCSHGHGHVTRHTTTPLKRPHLGPPPPPLLALPLIPVPTALSSSPNTPLPTTTLLPVTPSLTGHVLASDIVSSPRSRLPREYRRRVVDLGIASDKPGTLEETLRDAMRKVDLVITTGGVSMGELDLLKPTIERALSGTIHFGRVAMKPGKPATFATVPVKNNNGERVSKVIFSLPGNPASALVTFHLFVLPSLHQMSGITPPGLPKVPVILSHDFSLDKTRPEYHRAIVSVGKDGVLSATSTGGQRSSRVGSMKGANALLCMPSGPEPLRKGAKVEALMMGSLRTDM